MSQPALVSLLTGSFPGEHGVRHNGALYLRESIDTVAEVALKNGYRTAFFSGGAPIFRRSGLAQGFETFNDNILLVGGRYFRSARENFDLYLSWLDQTDASSGFFGVVYLNDLLFYRVPLLDEKGTELSLTRESRLRAIDAALLRLVNELKRRDLWQRTNLVLTGLNGPGKWEGGSDLPAVSLTSDSTQVTLMMKPPRRNRDEATSWAIDANVSLVDVGLTLYSFVGRADLSYLQRSFEVTQLNETLSRPKVNWNKSRIIPLESDWAHWRGIGPLRAGFRSDHWLIVDDATPKVYNTLTDRAEVSPTSDLSMVGQPLIDEFRTRFAHQNQIEWNSLPDIDLNKIQLGRAWAEGDELDSEMSLIAQSLLKEQPWDKDLLGFVWTRPLAKQNWRELLELSKIHLDPVWRVVLRRLMGVKVPEEGLDDDCVAIVESPLSRSGRLVCKYRLLSLFGDWLQKSGGAEESKATMRFIRALYYKKIDRFILKTNYLSGLVLDGEMKNDLELELMDLVFRLPELRKYRLLIDASQEALDRQTLSETIE